MAKACSKFSGKADYQDTNSCYIDFTLRLGIENLLLEGDLTLVIHLVFHGKEGLWILNSWLCKSIDMVVSLHIPFLGYLLLPTKPWIV